MLHLTTTDLQNYERYYRANLINCLSGYKQASLIGTVNTEGLTNLALFSNIVHLGANPALIGYIQRPITATSHTYKNIIATNYYTINHVPVANLQQAHQTSATYNEGISEFDACGFVPQYIADFAAPFVTESPIKIGLKFVQEIPISLNNTSLIIGEVQHIILEQPTVVLPDGNLNLSQANTAIIHGLENYSTATSIAHYGYAKVPVTMA